MTARLDVTPKKTEQNRIVRTGKSEAEVTNKKNCARIIVGLLTKLTTDRHEASRGLFATAELLVLKAVFRLPLRTILTVVYAIDFSSVCVLYNA